MTSPTPQSILAAVVEDAYRVFARYTCAGSFVVCHCNCCMTEETEAELVRTPLRQIPSDLLAEYTNSAHGWDDDMILADMRYLLPRYLDLIAAGDVPSQLSLSQCLIRLSDAHWREKWPADEVAILDRFFDALMVARIEDVSLAEWPVGWRLAFEIDEVLCCTILAGGDVARVLRAWDAASDPQAAIHMAATRKDVKRVDGTLRLQSAYLEKYGTEAESIGAFLERPEVDERLETTFFTLTDPRLQKIVSDATNWI
jgi:hypothetical protein